MRTLNSFDTAVRRLCRQRGLTLGELAARAGCSASYLSKMLHRHRPLQPRIVRKIDEVLQAGDQLVHLAALQEEGGEAAPRPMQLPPSNADFLGRDELLRSMDCALAERGGTPITVVIEGGFWTGKTELAVQWASRAQQSLPGGCLFADLHGMAPGAPAAPSDVLAGFLRALGVPSRELADMEIPERVARYRSLLAERPAIVVLDNVADYHQVEPLMPGGSSVTVVTSREHQAALLLHSGGMQIELGPLEHEDALALLGTRVGPALVAADPDAAGVLVSRCGHLPMPILIAAKLVAERHDTTMRRLAERLASDRTRLDVFVSNDPTVNIHGVIDLSYLALERPAARVFRLLGVGPARVVGPASTAVLTELEPASAQEALDQLRRAHLLDPLPGGRYRMTPLLRAYAYQRGIVDEHLQDVERACDRTLRWYAATAWAANNALVPRWADNAGLPDEIAGAKPLSFEGFDAAMAWCNTEIDTALEVARAAQSYRAADIRWLLPTAFLPYFVLTRDWTRWLAAANSGLAAAEAIDSSRGIARSLQALGWVEHELGRPGHGVPKLREALRMHADLGDECSRAWTAYGLGGAYTATGDHSAALEHHLLAERLFTAHQATVGTIVNRTSLAAARHRLGFPDEALKLAKNALAEVRSLNSRVITSLVHHRLGVLLSRAGQSFDGLTHLDHALALRSSSWQRWSRAETLVARGEALASMQQAAQALESYRTAAVLLEELNDPRVLDVRVTIAALDIQTSVA